MATFGTRVRVAAKAAAGIFNDNSMRQAWGMLQGVLPGGAGSPPTKGTAEYLRVYSQAPWVRAVAGRVSTAVADAEWQLFVAGKPTEKARMAKHVARANDRVHRRRLLKELKEKDDLRQIVEHPMLDLLRDANEFQTGFAMRKITQLHFDLVGDAFWLKERDAQGTVVGVWPIPPHWIVNTPTPAFRFFRVNFRAWRGNIPDTEFVWFSDPDPMNPYARGSGMAMALGDEIETDEYASRYLKGFFYNSARPDLLVWPKQGQARPEDVRRIQEDWMQNNQGFFRAFKPYFLTREVGVETLEQNFRSLQLVQLREFERNVIMQTYGVPPEILGVLTNSNRSTIDAADYFMSRYVVEPRLEFQRQVLQERLAPEFDERLIVDYVSPVSEDSEQHLKTMQQTPWAANVDEHRAVMGLAPLEDKKAGKLHLVTAGRLQVIEESPDPALLPGASGVPGAPGSAPGGKPDDKPKLKPDDKPKRGLSVGWRSDAVECAASAREDGDVELADGIEKLLQGDAGLPVPSAEAARHEPTLTRKLMAAWRDHAARVDEDRLIRALESGSQSEVLRTLDAPGLGQDEHRAIVPVLVRAGLQGSELGARALRRVGVPVKGLDGIEARSSGQRVVIDLRGINQRVTEWAEERAASLVRTTDDVKEIIRLLVAEANERGIPPRDLAKILQDIIGLLPKQIEAVARFRAKLVADEVDADTVARRTERYATAQLRKRAMTIARTETIAAVNAGQQLLWEDAVRRNAIDADDFVRTWIVTDDDRLDPVICEPLDGVRVRIGQPFADGIMHPPAHPMCRCAMGLAVAPEKGASAIHEKYNEKFDSTQPRDPAGTPTGGQWTSPGTISVASRTAALSKIDGIVAARLTASNAYDRALEPVELKAVVEDVAAEMNKDSGLDRSLRAECVEGQCPKTGERYTLLMHDSKHLSVYLLRWQPGQQADWHDHGDGADGARVAVKVLTGPVENDFITRAGNVVRERLDVGKTYFLPAPYVHRVATAGNNETWSVHAYSGPRGGLNLMNFYKFDSKTNQPIFGADKKPIREGRWDARKSVGGGRISKDDMLEGAYEIGDDGTLTPVPKFDSTQPRDPAGTPTGGQWIGSLNSPGYLVGTSNLPKNDVLKYVGDRGERYDVQDGPPGRFENGDPNQSYKNASRLVIADGDLQYVEGWARRKGTKMAMLHAWVHDPKTGKSYDSSPIKPEEWDYFGVAYDGKQYLGHLLRTEKYGVLGGDKQTALDVMKRGGL